MKFSNLGPSYCMPRPKMMRKSWTLKVRLQYILARGLLKKKNEDNELTKEESKGDGYIVSLYLRRRVENLNVHSNESPRE